MLPIRCCRHTRNIHSDAVHAADAAAAIFATVTPATPGVSAAQRPLIHYLMAADAAHTLPPLLPLLPLRAWPFCAARIDAATLCAQRSMERARHAALRSERYARCR